MCKYIKYMICYLKKGALLLGTISIFLPFALLEIVDIPQIFEYFIKLVLVAVFSICFFVYDYYIRKVFTIKTDKNIIEIKYGDIFEESGIKVIPFDVYFTKSVGDAVRDINKNSLCGKFIINMQKDNKLELLSDILDNIDSLEFIQDNHGKKYKSGQIIKFDNYFLLAFANLDNDGRAFMTKEDYLSCLLELWKEINKNYAQNNVCIPLLGSGTTKLVDWNPTQQELLDTIICSYKLSSEKLKKPQKLIIVCQRNQELSLNSYFY